MIFDHYRLQIGCASNACNATHGPRPWIVWHEQRHAAKWTSKAKQRLDPELAMAKISCGLGVCKKLYTKCYTQKTTDTHNTTNTPYKRYNKYKSL